MWKYSISDWPIGVHSFYCPHWKVTHLYQKIIISKFLVKFALRLMTAFMPALCLPNPFIFGHNLGLIRAQSGHMRMKRPLFELFLSNPTTMVLNCCPFVALLQPPVWSSPKPQWFTILTQTLLWALYVRFPMILGLEMHISCPKKGSMAVSFGP